MCHIKSLQTQTIDQNDNWFDEQQLFSESLNIWELDSFEPMLTPSLSMDIAMSANETVSPLRPVISKLEHPVMSISKPVIPEQMQPLNIIEFIPEYTQQLLDIKPKIEFIPEYTQQLLDIKPKVDKKPSTDIQSLKRKRQNDAAKRCRMKKLSQIEQSQEVINSLRSENFEMEKKLRVYEQERLSQLAREQEMQEEIKKLRQEVIEANNLAMKLH